MRVCPGRSRKKKKGKKKKKKKRGPRKRRLGYQSSFPFFSVLSIPCWITGALGNFFFQFMPCPSFVATHRNSKRETAGGHYLRFGWEGEPVLFDCAGMVKEHCRCPSEPNPESPSLLGFLLMGCYQDINGRSPPPFRPRFNEGHVFSWMKDEDSVWYNLRSN